MVRRRFVSFETGLARVDRQPGDKKTLKPRNDSASRPGLPPHFPYVIHRGSAAMICRPVGHPQKQVVAGPVTPSVSNTWPIRSRLHQRLADRLAHGGATTTLWPSSWGELLKRGERPFSGAEGSRFATPTLGCRKTLPRCHGWIVPIITHANIKRR